VYVTPCGLHAGEELRNDNSNLLRTTLEHRMSNEFNSQQNENMERASIGRSITIKGEVSGSEDLLIHGSVEGTVNLGENTVTVGASAKVKADIFGKVIHVEGEVLGNLFGAEQVTVHRTGYVRGNITSPRLSLEDGARLKGSIDTEPTNKDSGLAIEKMRTDSADARAKAAAPAKTGQAPARDNSSMQ
jgi:cytoskeletal protein CcmA (bactofilin family)